MSHMLASGHPRAWCYFGDQIAVQFYRTDKVTLLTPEEATRLRDKLNAALEQGGPSGGGADAPTEPGQTTKE